MSYANVSFPDHLDMRWLGGTQKPDGSFYAWTDYMLLAEFRCFWTRGLDSGVITAPATLVMDRSSIPQIGRSFIPKDGSWQRPSIIHDWVFIQKGVPGCETFKQANDLFGAGMKAMGTPFFQRNIIMAAVSSPIGRKIWEDD